MNADTIAFPISIKSEICLYSEKKQIVSPLLSAKHFQNKYPQYIFAHDSIRKWLKHGYLYYASLLETNGNMCRSRKRKGVFPLL